MWVRGLKHIRHCKYTKIYWSHPMWVRGLKQQAVGIALLRLGVAPYVGAWIETC